MNNETVSSIPNIETHGGDWTTGRPIVLPTLGRHLSANGLHLQFSPNTKQTNKPVSS